MPPKPPATAVPAKPAAGISTLSAAVNCLNGSVSVGVLGLPYAFRSCGWAALLVVGVVGAATYYTATVIVRVLVAATGKDKKRNRAEASRRLEPTARAASSDSHRPALAVVAVPAELRRARTDGLRHQGPAAQWRQAPCRTNTPQHGAQRAGAGAVS